MKKFLKFSWVWFKVFSIVWSVLTIAAVTLAKFGFIWKDKEEANGYWSDAYDLFYGEKPSKEPEEEDDDLDFIEDID